MSVLWLLALALPVALALGLGARTSRRAALALAPWAPAPLLALALFPPPPLEVPALLLGTRLGADPVGEPLLLLVGVLWWLAGLQAYRGLARDPHRARFFAYFLVCYAGNAGLIMAQDAISFYAFFTLMTFAAYGLILHRGDAPAREAGRVYIILALIGEALLLAGVLMAVAVADTADFAGLRAALAGAPQRDLIIALLGVGFGIKVGVIPLHVWLPLAHPAAPAPASAVLSGTIIKAGLLGWLRFLPLGEAALPGWAALFVAAGLLAAFYGVAVGLVQRELKVVLAYSSISQMGFMTLGVGLALREPAHAPALVWAVLIYALHHGFAKGALFMGVAAAVPLPRGWRAGLALGGLALAALALAGAPLSSGAAAKALLKSGAELAWPGAQGLSFALSAAALGTTLLMARFLWLVAVKGGAGAPVRGVWVPWALVLVWVAGATWVIALFGAAPLAPTLGDTLGWSVWWPLLGGAGLALATAYAARGRGRVARPPVPPGDVLVPVQRALGPLAAVSFDVPRRRIHAFGLLVQRRGRALALGAAARVERRLARWRTPAALVLLLAVVLWLALAWGG